MLSPGRKTGEKIEFQEYRKTSSKEVKLCMYYQFAFSLTPEAALPQEAMPAILLRDFSYKSPLSKRNVLCDAEMKSSKEGKEILKIVSG